MTALFCFSKPFFQYLSQAAFLTIISAFKTNPVNNPMQLEPDFWRHKNLLDMNDAEWEALCDGCGKCCYRKYIDGEGKYERLYYTRIACNLLDLETGK